MTAVKDGNFSGITVQYGAVLFGGTGTQMLPPTCSIESKFVRSQDGRTIRHTNNVLTVVTSVFAATESDLSARLASIEDALSRPGRTLKITGLGLGTDPLDIMWGPFPLGLSKRKLAGELATEITWTVEYNTNPCLSVNNMEVIASLSFSTSWRYDNEGRCTARVVSGEFSIPQLRTIPRRVIDQFRDKVQVTVPPNFERKDWSINENPAKDRIEFSYTDEQIVGDAKPPFTVEFKDRFALSVHGAQLSGGGKARLAMQIKMRPDRPQSESFLIFLREVVSRTNGMSIPNRVVAILSGMDIQSSRSDRETQYTAEWTVNGCFVDILNAANPWKRIDNTGNYNQWRASIQSLWDVRGTSGIGTQVSDDVIVDLCAGVTNHTITGFSKPKNEQNAFVTMPCPSVPEALSWLAYNFEVRLVRYENHSQNRRMVPYVIQQAQAAGQGAANLATTLVSPLVQAGPAEDHIIETNGLPTNYVLLKWKAMRVEHGINPPRIVTIGGQVPTQVDSDQPPSRVVFHLLCNPVHYSDGWILYRLPKPLAVVTNPVTPAEICSPFRLKEQPRV